MIRPANSADLAAIEETVRAAYTVYIARIGKPPGPMLDDYAALIAARAVSVVEDDDGTVAGLIVLLPQADHLLLDNIAVRPEHQGHGVGRSLIEFAEREAARRGLGELHLYTHETMVENIALYKRIGFTETGRGHQDGYDRVFMAKPLA